MSGFSEEPLLFVNGTLVRSVLEYSSGSGPLISFVTFRTSREYRIDFLYSSVSGWGLDMSCPGGTTEV